MAETMMSVRVDGMPDDAFRVRQVEGTDEMSGLYRFELELFSRKDDLSPADILLKKARLEIRRPVRLGQKTASSAAKIHGLISSFEQMEKIDRWCRYRAVLSPQLWKLTLARHNRVFRDMKVTDLVTKILGEAGLKPEIAVSSARPVREFTVQYRESDCDFLRRWLEHEGIFTFFRQSGSEETAVFADNTAAHQDIEGTPEVDFEPDEAPAGVVVKKERAEGTIAAFSMTAKPLPREVVLVDWDDRRVEEIRATATVDEKGFGRIYEYGFNPGDERHAEILAKARAEAIMCRGRIFSGTGRCRFFRAGATFTLRGHYRKDFNAKYLITRVVHRISQPVEIPRVKELPDSYANEFQCVPAEVPFRPERVTPWPKIHGFADALVVAGGGHSKQDMDDQGRYRVRMMYDKDDSGQPSDSNQVRMAQPYAGDSFGMHFPLHPDTEVIVGHKDGDPDRPVVLSSVPNPKKKSPVVGENATQCVIKTGAGNMIRLEDKGGGEDFFIYAKKDKDTRVGNDEKKVVEKNKHTIIRGDRIDKIEGERHETVLRSHVEEVKEDRFITVGGKQAVEIGPGGLCVKVQGPALEIFLGNHMEDCMGVSSIRGTSVIVVATAGITLACDGSYISIGPDGVTIKGNILTLDGSLCKINSGPGAPAQSGKTESEIKPSKPKAPEEATS